MKIIIISDVHINSSKGGVEVWLSNFAQELGIIGNDVFYLNNGQINSVSNDYTSIGFGSSKRSSSKYLNRSVIKSILFGLKISIWLYRNASKGDIVYIHQTPYFTVIGGSLVQRFRKFRIFIEWIEIWNLKFWLTEYGFLIGVSGFSLQQTALKFSKFIITASPSVKLYSDKFLHKEILHLPGQYVHRRPPVSFENILLNKKNNSFLIVSRISSEKNIFFSIDFFLQYQKICHNSKLTIVGTGPQDSMLEERLNNIDENINITWLLSCDEVLKEKLYAETAYLLHASKREGFGLVIGESASWGVIPILYSHEQNDSIRRNEEIAVIFNDLNISVLVNKILEINKEYALHSKKAFDFMLENLKSFSCSSSAQEFNSFIRGEKH